MHKVKNFDILNGTLFAPVQAIQETDVGAQEIPFRGEEVFEE